jgi:hypothetical protein
MYIVKKKTISSIVHIWCPWNLMWMFFNKSTSRFTIFSFIWLHMDDHPLWGSLVARTTVPTLASCIDRVRAGDWLPTWDWPASVRKTHALFHSSACMLGKGRRDLHCPPRPTRTQRQRAFQSCPISSIAGACWKLLHYGWQNPLQSHSISYPRIVNFAQHLLPYVYVINTKF